eukprot:9851677-Heterocapsa_arctica.AAC.1
MRSRGEGSKRENEERQKERGEGARDGGRKRERDPRSESEAVSRTIGSYTLKRESTANKITTAGQRH